MAHEFTIFTTSNETVVYTDYDSINLSTLKHVLSFKPDLGTLVDSHEMLLETATINYSATQGVMLENNNSVTDTNGVTYAVPAEDKLLLEDGGQLMLEAAAMDALGKLVPENFAAGLENHLVLETSSDTVVDNHYHAPVAEHHEDGDGHTEEQHREISLWNYKLQLLMARERRNNAS
tara:strand:- start:1446 stop:1976 length:531 start_codon:yes stop_codon:yes gene_type:complete